MASQTPFLAELAADLYGRYHREITQLTVVLPHEQSVKVLRQHWVASLPPKAALPKVLSIDSFIQQLSPLKPGNPLLLNHLLYQTFQALQSRKEPFEQFYAWGSLLLEDFDVIDRYLVDAVHLFTDLGNHKALGSSYDYLTEAQRATIQSFWKSFEKRLSTQQQDFLALWRLLPQVYQHFGKSLQTQGVGYPGLCQKAAYEALLQGTVLVQHHQLVFAGFNALTPVEEKIVVWYQENRPTSLFWDVDAYYMEDAQQEAGLYLREHQKKPHFQTSFSSPLRRRITAETPEIHITEVASEVGQVQVVRAQLQELMNEQGASFVPGKTAIVAANETLCMPMLRALMLDNIQASTPLGYPLKDTAAYRLLAYLLALQSTIGAPRSPTGYFPMRQVLEVLRHPHVMGWDPAQVRATIHRLQATPRSYVPSAELVQKNVLYAEIFKVISLKDGLIRYLIETLQAIEAGGPEATLRPLEKMAFQQLLQQLGHLQALLVAPLPNPEALLQLLRQLVQPVQLPVGDQASGGVQVLDVLATQNLDFDHVFIVGMNEGHFPVQASSASVIPYTLRKGYGLPTADQHPAALYAYHFYRLLQRAQRVCMTYSTQTTADGQGEMSRYLLQLLYASKLCMQKQAVAQPIHLVSAQPIVIPKEGTVLHQLQQYTLQSDGNVQPLTPSALNTYLDCSLRFYFQYLAQLKASTQPQQATHALVFGNLLHEVMEKLYTPLLTRKQGERLHSKDFVALQKKVPTVVKAVFSGLFQQHQQAVFQGDHAIAQSVMVKIVNRILVLDQAHAPFVLIGLEVGRRVPLSLDFVLNATTRVRLRGIIDRVDWKDGVFRVLDYKTGMDEKRVKSLPSLFDRTNFRGNKAAFQTFFYAWLFQQQGFSHAITSSFLPVSQSNLSAAVKVMPGLFNTRQLFDADFDPRFSFQQPSRRTYSPIEDVTAYQQAWEEGLRTTLMELLDATIPFSQTNDVTRCTSCPYKGICERR